MAAARLRRLPIQRLSAYIQQERKAERAIKRWRFLPEYVVQNGIAGASSSRGFRRRVLALLTFYAGGRLGPYASGPLATSNSQRRRTLERDVASGLALVHRYKAKRPGHVAHFPMVLRG